MATWLAGRLAGWISVYWPSSLLAGSLGLPEEVRPLRDDQVSVSVRCVCVSACASVCMCVQQLAKRKLGHATGHFLPHECGNVLFPANLGLRNKTNFALTRSHLPGASCKCKF